MSTNAVAGRSTSIAGKAEPRAKAEYPSMKYVDKSYEELLEFGKMVGIDQSDDIAAQKAKTLACVKALMDKYPADRKRLIKEIEGIYDVMFKLLWVNEEAKDPNMFCLSLSMFMQVNQELESLFLKNITSNELIANLREIPERDIYRNDERTAFRAKYDIILAYNAEEMTPMEISLFKGLKWQIPPNEHEMSFVFANCISTCSIDRELSRYPKAILANFPRRMAVTLMGGGVVYPDPAYAGILIHSEPDVLHHELFHWLRRGRLSWVDGDNKTWGSLTSKLSTGLADEPYAGFACEYGKTNVNEDQATVAGMLFSIDQETLRARLSCDPKLLAKVELITGCEYNIERGVFYHLMGPEDLKVKYGLGAPSFYADWSSVNGKVLMDANYWNRTIADNIYYYR